ncbi:MAG: Nif3-like dinuclear metal center hexameric protein [Gammaproteobacteria bacterium]
MLLHDLTSYLNDFLSIDLFKDYSPNGLQVQGRSEVKHIVTGVSACARLLELAIEKNADAILVHHGYFWRGEDLCVTGMRRDRLKRLLENDVSLLAYHLPLDGHHKIGNNAMLAEQLQIKVTGELDTGPGPNFGLIGCIDATTPDKFAKHIETCLGRVPLHVSSDRPEIKTLAWVTGAGQDFIEQAASNGCDAFLSGEISERTFHAAKELGIHYYACGHHATERYGIQALGAHVAKKFDVTCEFVDVDNPV